MPSCAATVTAYFVSTLVENKSETSYIPSPHDAEVSQSLEKDAQGNAKNIRIAGDDNDERGREGVSPSAEDT